MFFLIYLIYNKSYIFINLIKINKYNFFTIDTLLIKNKPDIILENKNYEIDIYDDIILIIDCRLCQDINDFLRLIANKFGLISFKFL